MWALSPERVTHVTVRFADTFRLYWERIKEPSHEDLVGVESVRRGQIEAGKEWLRNLERKATVDRARKAFKAKKYLEVVRLLAPFENELSPAEREKLRYAREHAAEN